MPAPYIHQLEELQDSSLAPVTESFDTKTSEHFKLTTSMSNIGVFQGGSVVLVIIR